MHKLPIIQNSNLATQVLIGNTKKAIRQNKAVSINHFFISFKGEFPSIFSLENIEQIPDKSGNQTQNSTYDNTCFKDSFASPPKHKSTEDAMNSVAVYIHN